LKKQKNKKNKENKKMKKTALKKAPPDYI